MRRTDGLILSEPPSFSGHWVLRRVSNGGCCVVGVEWWVLKGGQNGECRMVGVVWWVSNGGC